MACWVSPPVLWWPLNSVWPEFLFPWPLPLSSCDLSFCSLELGCFRLIKLQMLHFSVLPLLSRGIQGPKMASRTTPLWLDPQLPLPLVSKPGLQLAAGLSSPSLRSCPGLHRPRASQVLSLPKWLLPPTLLSWLSLTSLCCRYLMFLSAHHSYPLKGKRSDFPWAQPSSKTNQAGSQSLTSWCWARDPRHIQESQLWDFGELLGRAERFSGCAEMCTRSHEGRGRRWSCHRSSSRRRGRAWRPTLTPIFQVNDSWTPCFLVSWSS